MVDEGAKVANELMRSLHVNVSSSECRRPLCLLCRIMYAPRMYIDPLRSADMILYDSAHQPTPLHLHTIPESPLVQLQTPQP